MCAMASACGADSLVAAAVRAAILAKAPRRTVSAVAAAVVSAFVGATAHAATKTRDARQQAGTQRATECGADDDPAALLEALREARSSQRRRKKARRKAAKVVAADLVNEVDSPQPVGGALGETLQAPAACTAPSPQGQDMQPLVRDRDEETGVSWIAAACAAADERDEMLDAGSTKRSRKSLGSRGSCDTAWDSSLCCYDYSRVHPTDPRYDADSLSWLRATKEGRAMIAASSSQQGAQRVRRRRGKTRQDGRK